MIKKLTFQTVLVLCFTCLLVPFAWSKTVPQDMVSTSQHLATEVGVDILKQGGNAIDAAVAVGYALAVVEPCCGNLGGGGFMLIHFNNGKNVFIDFRETAPRAIKPEMFWRLNNKEPHPYLKVATPGTVMGLNDALKKYGTLPLNKVIAPAIELAEKGYVLVPQDIQQLETHTADFQRQPNIAAIFLNHGKPWQVGERLRQPQLAKTLKKIAAQGDAGFYQGEVAQALVDASRTNGGVMSLQDLAAYRVKERAPIICTYRGNMIITSPPPGSGATLCEILNIVEGYPLAKQGYRSAQSMHEILEAMRLGFNDRNHYLGDSDFIKIPTASIVAKSYAAKLRGIIAARDKDMNNAVTKAMSTEGHNTTHFSIMDKYGNAVAVTYTINSYFGANIIAGNTGFFLNNEMDDFTLQPGKKNIYHLIQGNQNSVAPKKRPLSSMCPTIVLKNNKPFLVLGAPGGSTIITQIAEALMNIIDYNMPLDKAIEAPRFHFQSFPDMVSLEANAITPATQKQLEKMGYHFKFGSPFTTVSNHDSRWGAIAAVEHEAKTGQLIGHVDSRRPGGLAKGS